MDGGSFRPTKGAVLIIALLPKDHPRDVVCVFDPDTKPLPIYRKFPGGAIEADQTPQQAARAELLEETGLAVEEKDLRPLLQVERAEHTLYVFGTSTDDTTLATRGDEGEIPHHFPLEEILGDPAFHPNHQKILLDIFEELSKRQRNGRQA